VPSNLIIWKAFFKIKLELEAANAILKKTAHCEEEDLPEPPSNCPLN
jgi:hypothetical protein